MSLTTCRNCEENICEDDIKDNGEEEEEEKEEEGQEEDKQADAGLETEAALLQGDGDDGITVRARTFKYIFTEFDYINYDQSTSSPSFCIR